MMTDASSKTSRPAARAEPAGTSFFPKEERPQQELVRLCARTQLPPATEARVRELLQSDLDAETLLQESDRHRVFPLVHRHLQTLAGDVPPEVLQPLKAHAGRTALRNLRRFQELLRVLARLDAEGIPALPFKGPTLGLLVYGDVALRPFGDLDVLVPKDRIADTEALLCEDGYRLYGDLTPEEVRRRLGTEKSYELVRGDVVVELHWAFLHPMHGFDFDPDAVWARARPVQMGGRRVPALAPEDLVLYLCAHGGKHFWIRLSWVCDVAEALRTYREVLRWPVLLERAERLHGRRMLLLGCTLAGSLLGAPLPDAVAQAASKDKAVRQLGKLSCARLFQEAGGEEPNAAPDDAHGELKDARFHLLMRGRWRDRLPYYRHLLRLACTPTEKDRALLDLPPRLSFLYYLLRPVRLLRDAARRGLRAVQDDAAVQDAA